MRKRMIEPGGEAAHEERWLDLERLATVELTSEQEGWPIEAALGAGPGGGWRAGDFGTQTIRLVFDVPQCLRRILLVFDEAEQARTQEYVLRASADGSAFREVVRQQFVFSPPGTTREREVHQVDLPAASVLELQIVPDVGGGPARASLSELRLA